MKIDLLKRKKWVIGKGNGGFDSSMKLREKRGGRALRQAQEPCPDECRATLHANPKLGQFSTLTVFKRL